LADPQNPPLDQSPEAIRHWYDTHEPFSGWLEANGGIA
jgi:hypothetical protein